MIEITPNISIEENEIQEVFVRSSGPGGQNVNKVASAVQLRFNVAESPSLPEAVKDRLRQTAGHRMTDDGVLIITAQRHRTQGRNRADARDRLVSLIRKAATPPKRRRNTKRTRASVEKRLNDKRHRSEIKNMRKYKR